MIALMSRLLGTSQRQIAPMLKLAIWFESDSTVSERQSPKGRTFKRKHASVQNDASSSLRSDPKWVLSDGTHPDILSLRRFSILQQEDQDYNRAKRWSAREEDPMRVHSGGDGDDGKEEGKEI